MEEAMFCKCLFKSNHYWWSTRKRWQSFFWASLVSRAFSPTFKGKALGTRLFSGHGSSVKHTFFFCFFFFFFSRLSEALRSHLEKRGRIFYKESELSSVILLWTRAFIWSSFILIFAAVLVLYNWCLNMACYCSIMLNLLNFSYETDVVGGAIECSHSVGRCLTAYFLFPGPY